MGPKMNRILLVEILGLFLIGLVMCAPPSRQISETDNAMTYLSRYGYLQTNSDQRFGGLLTIEIIQSAVRNFQEFASLPVTGELDNVTTTMMKVPRCGVKDKKAPEPKEKYSRFERYILHGGKWKSKHLSYRIMKYPANFKKTITDEEISRAFGEWSKVSSLDFSQKTSGQADMEIRFEVGDHDDDDPFDGPGGTLAHAYFPTGGGDVHFDDDETWSSKSRRGTNLFRVAVHEFGHSLGLEHSKVQSAIMFPFYRGYDPQFEFDRDDIRGIQALYGPRESGVNEEEKPKNRNKGDGGESIDTDTDTDIDTDTDTKNEADLCTDAKFDAIFRTLDGMIYILKGSVYWLLRKLGPLGHPRPISEKWIGLPSNIDAAFSGLNGRIYFFKGSKYWRYNGMSVDQGFPKEISAGFDGIPNNIDAAMWINHLNKGFFFKGNKYWVYDADEKLQVKSSYPKSIEIDFHGIPSNLDDVLHTTGNIYFFRNGFYYKINDLALENQPDVETYPSPRSMKLRLLHCFENI